MSLHPESKEMKTDKVCHKHCPVKELVRKNLLKQFSHRLKQDLKDKRNSRNLADGYMHSTKAKKAINVASHNLHIKIDN